MADKPGFPVGELGQVFVTTKEGAEGNKDEMVEELHGEEESDDENSVVKSDLTLKDYASSLYEEAGGLVGPVEDFKTGCLKLLLGHAESWMSRTAQDILDSLREKGLVILTIVDEAHIPLADHWDSFRPQLKLVPCQLRGRAVKGAPTLAMTATLTPAEVKELESSLGLRSNTVLLKANPIQEHHKFVR